MKKYTPSAHYVAVQTFKQLVHSLITFICCFLLLVLNFAFLLYFLVYHLKARAPFETLSRKPGYYKHQIQSKTLNPTHKINGL